MPVVEHPVFFSAAFEALFHRTLAGKLTPELKDRFRALGVDPDKPLKAAYPYQTWEDAIAAAARAVHPGVGDLEASFRLGLDFFEGFNATLIGKAAIGMARLVGTQRMLSRFTSNLRNTNNMTEGIVELNEPGRARLRLRVLDKFMPQVHPSPPHVPQYLRGVLLGVLRGLQLPEARVEISQSVPARRETVYELSWRA